MGGGGFGSCLFLIFCKGLGLSFLKIFIEREVDLLKLILVKKLKVITKKFKGAWLKVKSWLIDKSQRDQKRPATKSQIVIKKNEKWSKNLDLNRKWSFVKVGSWSLEKWSVFGGVLFLSSSSRLRPRFWSSPLKFLSSSFSPFNFS